MITVSILINGQPIYTRSAVNISDVDDGIHSTYELDTGQTIVHKQQDGAVALAIEMLKTIKDTRRPNDGNR